MDYIEKRKNSNKNVIIISVAVLITLIAILVYLLYKNAKVLTGTLLGAFILGFFGLSYAMAGVEVTTETSMYSNVIGEYADSEYAYKWVDDTEIFPASIESLDVCDFKMVYYNPFDAQYLGYLVVQYDDEAYLAELERLSQVGMDDYIGEYGATGFAHYDVAAMKVGNQHYGMVYALNDDATNTIAYVELIFCNFFYDLDYTEYIDESYLPEDFNAQSDNPYREVYLDELQNPWGE